MPHTEADCLHCAMNRIVEERAEKVLDANAIISLPEWLDDMVLSVADLILYAAPPEQHQHMLAHAVARLQEIVTAEGGDRRRRN
jgi:hypothetical protein